MPEKPGKNREQLKEITDRIEAGIRDIFESGDMEKYRNYLRTMSRFHNYSQQSGAHPLAAPGRHLCGGL